jgi:peptidoglycan/LPS O-acetylase OafA/YrhL
MPLPNFFKRGDYSYGVYLYHQPLLQMIVSLFPTMALAPGIGAPCTFLLGLPFVFLTAWLSWHLVEKPLLMLRKAMSAAGRSGRTNDVSVRDNSIAAE